jgi:hypothetical protein
MFPVHYNAMQAMDLRPLHLDLIVAVPRRRVAPAVGAPVPTAAIAMAAHTPTVGVLILIDPTISISNAGEALAPIDLRENDPYATSMKSRIGIRSDLATDTAATVMHETIAIETVTGRGVATAVTTRNANAIPVKIASSLHEPSRPPQHMLPRLGTATSVAI